MPTAREVIQRGVLLSDDDDDRAEAKTAPPECANGDVRGQDEQLESFAGSNCWRPNSNSGPGIV
jgi:hypothetical protein